MNHDRGAGMEAMEALRPTHRQEQLCILRSAKRSLERLKEKGIRRVVATGRHRMELPELPWAASTQGLMKLMYMLSFSTSRMGSSFWTKS